MLLYGKLSADSMEILSGCRNVDSTRTSGFKAIKSVIYRFCLEVVCVGSERYVGGGCTDSGGQKWGITLLQMCQDCNKIQETDSSRRRERITA